MSTAQPTAQNTTPILPAKPQHAGFAALVSGILLGLSYLPWSPIVTAFVALVPLLWAMYRSNFSTFAAIAFFATALALVIADWELWLRMGPMGTVWWLIQAILMTLPWLLAWQITFRHNARLGYFALFSLWVTMEWLLAQYAGYWQGIQLGYAPIWLPFLVQWYSFLGITGGSLWLVLINIQIYQILWPENSKTKRGALINGTTLLFVPLLISGILFFSGGNAAQQKATITAANMGTELVDDRPTILGTTDQELMQQYQQKNNAEVLAASGQIPGTWLYQKGTDTIAQAFLISQKDSIQPIRAVGSPIYGILGAYVQYFTLSKWAGQNTALLSNSSLLRSELVRLYAKQQAHLFVGVPPIQPMGWLQEQRYEAAAIGRALETRQSILFINTENEVIKVGSAGQYTVQDISETAANIDLAHQKVSFFTNYGDLVGRISVFTSLYLALSTLVRRFRRK